MKTIFDSNNQPGGRFPTFGFTSRSQAEIGSADFYPLPEDGNLVVLPVVLSETEFWVDRRQLQEVASARACQLQTYPNSTSQRTYLSQLRGRPLLVLSHGADPESQTPSEGFILVWNLSGVLVGLLVDSVGPSQEIQVSGYGKSTRDKALEFKQNKKKQKLLVLESVFAQGLAHA